MFAPKIKTHLQAQTVKAIAVGHQHNHVVRQPYFSLNNPPTESFHDWGHMSSEFHRWHRCLCFYFRGCPMPSQPSTEERGWWASGGVSMGQCLEWWWDQLRSWRPSPPPRTGCRVPRYVRSDWPSCSTWKITVFFFSGSGSVRTAGSPLW